MTGKCELTIDISTITNVVIVNKDTQAGASHIAPFVPGSFRDWHTDLMSSMADGFNMADALRYLCVRSYVWLLCIASENTQE